MNTIGIIKKTMGVKDKWGVPRKWIIYYNDKHESFLINVFNIHNNHINNFTIIV